MADQNTAYSIAPITSTAAPKLPDYYPEETHKKEKSSQHGKQNKLTRNFAKSVAAIILAAAVAFGMLALVIRENSIFTDNKKTINNLNSKLAEVQAENIRLNSCLESTVSADKIQDYAVNVLGMQKAERYQIHYFEDRDGDEVVIADGHALNADRQD